MGSGTGGEYAPRRTGNDVLRTISVNATRSMNKPKTRVIFISTEASLTKLTKDMSSVKFVYGPTWLSYPAPVLAAKTEHNSARFN